MTTPEVLITIFGMAVATFATRAGGILLLRNRVLDARTRAVLEAAPGCVLVAAIAPHFVSSHPPELIALALTILASWRLPMLATVAVGVGSLALLQVIWGT